MGLSAGMLASAGCRGLNGRDAESPSIGGKSNERGRTGRTTGERRGGERRREGRGEIERRRNKGGQKEKKEGGREGCPMIKSDIEEEEQSMSRNLGPWKTAVFTKNTFLKLACR